MEQEPPAQPQLPEIHVAIRDNDMDRLRELVKAGDVNLRTHCGKTPLMTAGYYCRKAAIEMLLENGAVTNALDDETGDTAAHYITLSTAGFIKQCGCMMMLSQFDADISIQNNDGYTVTALAEKNGNHDIASAYESVR
eukprot:TRINITY_DN3548_c0_g8_i1.p1 TRINITY_DN3548_c0_g8~~TRINITY_DN3548_c0_g8_i1.p1  ORF type:complete len:138 (+),score=33.52 TRINITY_DN3548_c0_g8_i1:91-504(+)